MAKKPKEEKQGFTGVSFSCEAFKENGIFTNFKILTIFIVNGDIVHIERSQPYSTFEAVARTEVMVNAAIWNLSSRYKHGDAQSLGGEHTEALVKKLSKENPEVLEKIKPALYLKEERE